MPDQPPHFSPHAWGSQQQMSQHIRQQTSQCPQTGQSRPAQATPPMTMRSSVTAKSRGKLMMVSTAAAWQSSTGTAQPRCTRHASRTRTPSTRPPAPRRSRGLLPMLGHPLRRTEVSVQAGRCEATQVRVLAARAPTSCGNDVCGHCRPEAARRPLGFCQDQHAACS